MSRGTPADRDFRIRRLEGQTKQLLSGTPPVSALTRTKRAVSSSVSLLASDSVLLADASGGAITLTLPNASGASGVQLDIKKTDSSQNAVTIDGFSSQTIDDETTHALTTQYDSLTVFCDGTEWWIL